MGEATPLLLPPLLPPTFLPHFQLRTQMFTPGRTFQQSVSGDGMDYWGDGELPGPGCGPMGLGTTWKEDRAGILV